MMFMDEFIKLINKELNILANFLIWVVVWHLF